MTFTILNFIFSFLFQILLAYLYGTTREMDVYVITLAIPFFISGILISTMAVVFIPLFKEFIVKNDEESLRGLINTIISYLIVVLSIITIILFFFSPSIISSMASSFSDNNRALAVSLLKILSFSIIPMGLYSLFTVIYNSKESFLKPSLVRFLGHPGNILFVILFNRFLGIRSLVYGFMFSTLIQFFIMLCFLKEEKIKFKFTLSFNKAKIDNIWRMTFIVIGGILSFGLIIPSEKFLASRFSEGSVAYFGYAESIFSILSLLPSMAIPTIILPQLAGHYAVDDISKLRSTFSSGIRSTLFITLPLIVVLFIFREQIIYIFLQRGAFGQQATIHTAMVLVCYLGVFFESERLVILNTLYAMKEVMAPFVIGIITFILYILIVIPLSARMSFPGIALAHSLVFFAYCAMNLVIVRTKIRHIDGIRIFFSALKMVISSIAAGAIMWIIFNILTSFIYTTSAASTFLKLTISIFVGIILYVSFCFLLRLKELNQFYKVIVLYKRQFFLETVGRKIR